MINPVIQAIGMRIGLTVIGQGKAEDRSSFKTGAVRRASLIGFSIDLATKIRHSGEVLQWE